MERFQFEAYRWAPTHGIPFRFVLEEETTEDENGVPTVQVPWWNAMELPNEGELAGVVEEDNRSDVVGNNWRFREWFWPWCTVRAGDPFSCMAPMPSGWAATLARVCHPRILVEIQNCDLYYMRLERAQRVHLVFRYLFDYYPWVLPPEIGRRPRWEDLTWEQQDAGLPIGPPLY
jgi:hypothetical protein